MHVSYLDAAENTDPVNKVLPPFYLPQALGQLLPRLLPLGQPKTYLFATWVSESRALMMRYVDVGTESRVEFNGRLIRANRVRKSTSG